ncbi:YadA-like family protein [Halomonas sp. EF61]|uniref:beta strand repeat-containing protein n=1 Tax=Halomonas sp. EF61 TaxID=2950869 RepID=UPI0032DEDC79
MVLGDSGEASASNAIAIGTNAKASVANSVALGNGATTEAVVGTTQATIAGKSYSFAGAAPTGTLSLGAAATTDSGGNAVASVERTITHVAAGRLSVTSTDAVNGSQLNATNQALGELSEGVQALGDLSDGVVVYDRGTGGTLNEGSITLAGDAGTRITNLTDATLSTDSTDAVTGRQLNATNVRVTQNEGDITNLTTNLGDIAADSIYYQTKSSGSGASASGTDSLAMGPAAVSSATNGVAIGNGAKASVANSVALGNGATTEATVATTTATVAGTDYALAGSSPTGTVSVGTSGSERTITHVAAGRLSATSTDAVNGSQLHATNQALGALAEGAVVYDRGTGGTLNEGRITLAGDAGTRITNLTDATLSTDSTDAVTGRQLNATNVRVTQNEGDITNLTTNLGDLAAGAVVYDRSDDGTLNEGSITLAGDAGTRITNLTDATLSTDSTDAVTGRQLNATNIRVTQNEGDITNLTSSLGDLAAGAVVYDRSDDGTLNEGSITLAGDAGTRITNLTDATLSIDSTDAVTGRQLNATNVRVTQNEGDIANLTTNLEDIAADSVYYQAKSSGSGASASGTDSLAMGPAAVSSATNGVAIGNGAKASVANSVALGNGATTEAAVATTTATVAGTDYALAGSSPTGTVSVGTSGSERTITHVAAGRLSATSTDAVNGSQLHATNQALGDLAEGAVVYDRGAGGTLNEGRITLAGDAGTRITNLTDGTLSSDSTDAVTGRQLNATNIRVTQNEGDITNLTTNLGDLAAGAVVYDRSDDGTLNEGSITLAGDAGTRITNLTDATLSTDSTDAVTGRQLNATNVRVTQNEGDIANLTSNLGDLAAGAVVYDRSDDGTLNEGSITLAGDAGTRITNLTDATLSTDSTDAVTGRQLNATNVRVTQNEGDITNLTTNLGDLAAGAVVYDRSDDGTLNEGSITLAGDAGTRITNLTDATLSTDSTDAVTGRQLNATNVRVTKNEGDITNLTTNLGDLAAGAVVYDRSDDGTLNEGSITLAGDAGTRITNLTDATLSSDSTDAVTGRQLNATNVRVTQNEGDITNLTSNLGDIAADSTYYQANSSASGAIASGTDSLAMGAGAESSATNAVAIGNGASSSVVGGVALGSGAIANREVAKVSGQIVVGNATIQYNTSDADLIGAVSVGQDGEYRQLINIADGIEDHDAVTMRQLKGAVGSLSDTGSLYFHANGEGEVDALAAGEGSIAIGPDTTVNGDDAIGMGVSAKVEIGAAGAVAIGDQSHTLLEDAIAVGSSAVSSGEQAMALGAGASANQALDVALGAQSTTQEAIGTESGIIFGEQHEYAGTNPIATVSVGDEGQERTLTHLAAGRISATSTDAVNGSQLYATNKALEEVVAYDHFNDGSVDWNHVTLKSSGRTSGGAVLGNVADGSLSDSSLEAVNGSQLHATNGRLTDLEGDVGDIQTTLDNLGGGNGNSPQEVVQYDPNSSQGKITLAGAGGGTVISNLADGDIRQGSTDAVNGGQIWDLMEDMGDLSLGGQDSKHFQANSQGDAATASAADTVAIGGDAKAQAEGGVALGDGAVADREGMKGEEEAFSGVAVESSKGAVAVGSEGGERQITHVAGGTEDTDAVNVRQLSAVQEGAVNYDRSEDGSVDYNSVSLGNGSGPTQLHNVAAGSAPTDAVNMSQLNELNRKFTSDYNQLDHKIDEVERDASAGIAALAAMGDAPYVAGKLTYHLGTGYYNGESALGVSLRRTADTGRWSVGMGIGASHGGPTIGLGISGVID